MHWPQLQTKSSQISELRIWSILAFSFQPLRAAAQILVLHPQVYQLRPLAKVSGHIPEHIHLIKAAKYEIRKPSTWRETLFRCKFWSMFPVFHLAWSTCRTAKTFVAGWRKLLRKVERRSTLCNKFWLCCSFFIKLTTWRATNLLALRQINQSERCIRSTRNKCFCCGSSWLRKVQNGKHRPKLATKQCCAPSWGFLYLVFSPCVNQFTIGSCFSVHYRVMEHAGSLESTKETEESSEAIDSVDLLCVFQSLESSNLGFFKATFPDSRLLKSPKPVFRS